MMVRSRRWRRVSARSMVAPFSAVALLLVGCGGQPGVQRYSVSGEVRFDGKPVPNGYLRFSPDKSKGNKGPGASASIVDGRYETMPNRGTVGGPHKVIITGADGVPYKTKSGNMIPIGRPLFPEIEQDVDLPKEDGHVQDFDLTTE